MIINIVGTGLIVSAVLLLWFNLWRVSHRLLYRLLFVALSLLSLLAAIALSFVYEYHGVWGIVTALSLSAVVFVPVNYGKSIKRYIRYRKDSDNGADTAWYSEWKQSRREKRKQIRKKRQTKPIKLPSSLISPLPMNGYDYEQFLAESLRVQGYTDVTVTPKSRDFGADVIATNKHGEKICFQCKHYSGIVGIESVQEIAAAKKHYGCDRGAVVTNSKFTEAAKELALSNEIDLIEGYEALFYD